MGKGLFEKTYIEKKLKNKNKEGKKPCISIFLQKVNKVSCFLL